MNKSKKRLIFILLAAVIVIAGSVTAIVLLTKDNISNEPISAKDLIKISSADFIKKDSPIFLTAHRGLSAVSPENSIPAFNKASQSGFKCIEFDTMPTKEGFWVVSHDDELERMTTGLGKISEKTYLELLQYSFDNGANIEQYEGLKIPSLDEILSLCIMTNVIPMIEVKAYYNDENINQLVSLITNRELDEKAIIISFDKTLIEKVLKINPKIKAALLISSLTEKNTLEYCKNNKIGLGFDGNNKKNTDELIKEAVASKIELYSWTIDDLISLERLYNLGIRNFTTNCITPE